jgi:hypothetical protein
VVAIILGQPLSITTCSDLPNEPGRVLLPLVAPTGQGVSYVVFSGAAGQTTCYELMAVWGLVIALCILFAISAISAGFLYLGKRRAAGSISARRFQMNESQIEMAPPKRSFSQSSSPEPQQFVENRFGGPGRPGSPAGSFGGQYPASEYGPGSPTFDNRPPSPAGSFDGPGGLRSPPPARGQNWG